MSSFERNDICKKSVRRLLATEFKKRTSNVGEGKLSRSQPELVLGDVSLFLCPVILGMNEFRAGGKYPEMYLLIALRPLQNSHIVISKMLKECLASYPSSDSM